MKNEFHLNTLTKKIKTKQEYYRPKAYSYLIIIQFFMINLIILCTIYLNNCNSTIHLVIQGNGNQKILGDYFKIFPSKVLVNGIKNENCNKTCYLKGDRNNITLIFENQIESCKQMFSNLSNIIEIDLSDFDASMVKSMYRMLYYCENLEKINFGNINTSSLEEMKELFNNFKKLTSIDLSNFDASKVTTMNNIFNSCENLEKINFGNINTSSLEDMNSLFMH